MNIESEGETVALETALSASYSPSSRISLTEGHGEGCPSQDLTKAFIRCPSRASLLNRLVARGCRLT